jgi:hypothetical protein
LIDEWSTVPLALPKANITRSGFIGALGGTRDRNDCPPLTRSCHVVRKLCVLGLVPRVGDPTAVSQRGQSLECLDAPAMRTSGVLSREIQRSSRRQQRGRARPYRAFLDEVASLGLWLWLDSVTRVDDRPHEKDR